MISFKWCALPKETAKCAEFIKYVNMTARNLSLEVTVKCVSGRSPKDCITKTKSGQADLVTLDGGNVYEGGKLRILAFEFNGRLDGSQSSYFLAVTCFSQFELSLQNLGSLEVPICLLVL